jgi:hypothetical protein
MVRGLVKFSLYRLVLDELRSRRSIYTRRVRCGYRGTPLQPTLVWYSCHGTVDTILSMHGAPDALGCTFGWDGLVDLLATVPSIALFASVDKRSMVSFLRLVDGCVCVLKPHHQGRCQGVPRSQGVQDTQATSCDQCWSESLPRPAWSRSRGLMGHLEVGCKLALHRVHLSSSSVRAEEVSRSRGAVLCGGLMLNRRYPACITNVFVCVPHPISLQSPAQATQV